MQQIVYVSSARADTISIPEILTISRRNNARDGITGLLYSDGTRFLQALEGPAETVNAALDRIRRDPRHVGVVVLSTREIETREFGEWEMAHRQPGRDADLFIRRIAMLTKNAAPNVRATFESFATVRRAA